MGVPRVLAWLPAEVRRSSRMITKTSGSSSTANPSRSWNGYPVELDLVAKLAVVVGGGAVALRRTRALVEAGALVTVIAPDVTSELAALPVTLRRRRYRDGDLAGAWLVHAATDDPAVNAAVAAEADRERIWCVRADDGAASAARTPPVPRPGDITAAVTAGGGPPRSQPPRSATRHSLASAPPPVPPP